jgi:replicative DNA helicase
MAQNTHYPEGRPSGEQAGGRVPPQAVDVERAVLGAMLIDKEAAPKVLELLDETSFYNPTHQKIYQAMMALFEKGDPIDSVTVVEELRRRGQLNAADDPSFITELTMGISSSANVEYHSRIVLEKALMRSLIASSSDIVTRAYSDTEDALDLLDEAEGRIFQISERRLKKSFTPIKRAVHETFELLESLHGKHSGITGVPTGFTKLDEMTGGFQNSDLIIVAGRPSQGKTALALSIARNAALHKEKKTGIAIFSLEMSEQQLIIRLLSSEARVNAHLLRTGKLADDQWAKLSRNAGRLSEAKIFIDDSATLSILELRAKARRLKAEQNIGMIVVDYLQLIQGPKSAESREREISTISRSLKALAKELNLPVVALSQLNRAVESRTDRRPMLADLRECVAGTTLVILSDGRRLPIRDLVGSTPEVLAASPDGAIVAAKSDKVWRVGVKPVFDMRLATGRTLRATAHHRVLTGDGWRQLDELAIGTRIALARRLPEPSDCAEWPEARVALLGQMIGDGSYLIGQPMRYTTSSEENSRIASAAACSEFGMKVTRYAGRRTWHQLLFSGNGNRHHAAGTNAWLRSLGVFGQRSYEKRIPAEAFRLRNSQMACLLRHLWATDGTIWIRPKTQSGAHSIYYATNSPGLAGDVAAGLLRLGIISRTYVAQKRGYKPAFHVAVSGSEEQRRFLDMVGAFGSRVEPANKLRFVLDSITPNTNVDTLPNSIFQDVRKKMSEQGISRRHMAALRGTTYGGTSHFRFDPSRATIAEYAEILDDDDLRQQASNDLFWDRVIAIEAAGEEEVFDLTVPGPASWLADGIVTHNSGAIEQDADVVMFVHRPETYGITEVKDDEGMTHPTEGMAEIIIGKQRNGPIGVVRLAFRKEYAGFERLAPAGLEAMLPPPPAAIPEETPF